MTTLATCFLLLLTSFTPTPQTDTIPKSFQGTWEAHSIEIQGVGFRVHDTVDDRYKNAFRELIITPDRVVLVVSTENAIAFAPRDLVLKNEQTIEFTADAAVEGGESFRGRLELKDGKLTFRHAEIVESGDSFRDFKKTIAYTGTREVR